MTNRKRTGRDTETLTPEQVAEAIARRQAENAATREPAPDRVVYSWPDEPADSGAVTRH